MTDKKSRSDGGTDKTESVRVNNSGTEMNGTEYRTGDGEIVTEFARGYWAEDQSTLRVWLKYRDGDCGSIPVKELNERLKAGEWETVKSDTWDSLSAR